MRGLFTTKKSQVLFLDHSQGLLAEVRPHTGGGYRPVVIARGSASRDDGVDIAAMIAGTGRKKTKVALVMPLKMFELASVTVPAVERDAVAKMLPYNLSKVLDSPISDYVYDWHVSQSFKDRQELTVFLHSAVRFEEYRHPLAARQREITWFEPDVFAACAYVLGGDRVTEEMTFVCVLLWPDSISIAVCEKRRITLVRSVEEEMPEEQQLDGTQDAAMEPGEVADDDVEADATGEEQTSDTAFSLEMESGEHPVADAGGDLLADFGLQESGEAESVFDFSAENQDFRLQEAVVVDPWEDYLEAVNLEVMRTADYHKSVLKGKAIQQVFIGGGDDFFSRLEAIIVQNQGIPAAPLWAGETGGELSPILNAICIGAASR